MSICKKGERYKKTFFGSLQGKEMYGSLQGKEMYGEKIHLHKSSKQFIFIWKVFKIAMKFFLEEKTIVFGFYIKKI